MRRGEVRWAEHPEWGRRPALVMTRDEAIERLNEVFTVAKGFLGERVTKLEEAKMSEVCRALEVATSCG